MPLQFDDLKNPFNLIDKIVRKGIHNVFRPQTPEEIVKQDEEEQKVKQEVKELARICADILRDQRYRQFAALYKDIEQRVIKLMINCDEQDRDKFFLKMRDYQKSLRIYDAILRTPHEFVKRGDEILRTEKKGREPAVERTVIR